MILVNCKIIHTSLSTSLDNIVHVQSGFLGHENDANCYRQIGSIGPHAHLKCPAVTFLETVFIQNTI
jgi:hypothetical protein